MNTSWRKQEALGNEVTCGDTIKSDDLAIIVADLYLLFSNKQWAAISTGQASPVGM